MWPYRLRYRVSDFILIAKVCHYNEHCTKGRLKSGIHLKIDPYDCYKKNFKSKKVRGKAEIIKQVTAMVQARDTGQLGLGS